MASGCIFLATDRSRFVRRNRIRGNTRAVLAQGSTEAQLLIEINVIPQVQTGLRKLGISN
ncbi:hypothetical protein D3C76_1858470 [compost metagenome]